MTYESQLTMDEHMKGFEALEALGIVPWREDVDDLKGMLEQVVGRVLARPLACRSE